ncbi:hypothetical protein B0T20DRAFT_414789 [Sordaria brevicollis]|uniref:Uncharacterized protein n=1 Tax=Sordaria brevicollis TaxID=83679 RepID=A0AAE0PBP1_SORBR|nr:hypothetical protein B0T20DRAFT_414789 [Sordaria brevicollis]
MPVVIKPDPDSPKSGKNHDFATSSPRNLILHAQGYSYARCPILHSSFSSEYNPELATNPQFSIVGNKNGFVHTIIRAWQQDLHLRIRPDDVWLAILTQFSFFVNKNAEALRHLFVSHKGRQEVEVAVDARSVRSLSAVDVGAVAQRLAAKVKERLVDPNIADTLLPTFTTTTPHDRDVAAIVFLGVTEPYFKSRIKFGCGLPSVTLLGERSDWADILRRLAWFETLGHEELDAWILRLAKVLTYMVASFDSPDGADVKDFWARTVHESPQSLSGGVISLSGWLTAFCWWGSNGERVKSYTDEQLLYTKPLTILIPSSSPSDSRILPRGHLRLTLDGVEFPVIDRQKVPPGVVTVPVTLHPHVPKKAFFVGGLMGMQVIEQEDDQTAAQPASGWWLLSAVEDRSIPLPKKSPEGHIYIPSQP